MEMEVEKMEIERPPVDILLRKKLSTEISEVVLRFVYLQQPEYDVLEQNPQLLVRLVLSPFVGEIMIIRI